MQTPLNTDDVNPPPLPPPSSVEAIYSVPVQDPLALQDPRVASLVQYAINVEKSMFENAASRVSV